MAERARAGHYSNFSSHYALPKVQLIEDLRDAKSGVHYNNKEMRDRTTEVIIAVKSGEYDDTRAEAEAWAASPEGQAMLKGDSLKAEKHKEMF